MDEGIEAEEGVKDEELQVPELRVFQVLCAAFMLAFCSIYPVLLL